MLVQDYEIRLSVFRPVLVVLPLGHRVGLPDVGWCSIPISRCDVHMMDVAQV